MKGTIKMDSFAKRLYTDDYDDIIGDYKILLGYGVSRDESLKKIIDYYYESYVNAECEYIFWIIIAEFQSMYGIIDEEVKAKAIFYIDNTEYLHSEEEMDSFKEIKKRLLHPNIEKKISKPPKYLRKKTDFNVGDVFSFCVTHDLLKWGEKVKKDVRDKLNETQIQLMNSFVLFRVVEVERIPVSHIMPELDYSSCPIIELSKEMYIKDIDMISDIAFGKRIITDFWSFPQKSSRYIILEPYEKKELKEWGDISFVYNKKIDEYVEGEISRSVYTNISKLVLDLIWTFYAE